MKCFETSLIYREQKINLVHSLVTCSVGPQETAVQSHPTLNYAEYRENLVTNMKTWLDLFQTSSPRLRFISHTTGAYSTNFRMKNDWINPIFRILSQKHLKLSSCYFHELPVHMHCILAHNYIQQNKPVSPFALIQVAQ